MTPLATRGAVLGVPSRGMARIPTLAALLAPAVLVTGQAACRRADLTALLAWGRKPSARTAEAIARARGLPLWRCEDGFLRSLGLGDTSPPWSVVVDDLGIYYDATAPSRLEALIGDPLSPLESERAAALCQLWRRERVSKYNGARDTAPPRQPFVLVVDQTRGDLSIAGGLADEGSFQRMLAAALDNHPSCRVVLKIHPDVAAGRKRGYLERLAPPDPRLEIRGDGGHPAALLEAAEAVYVVTSQLGFEALLWGRPVHCFGMPFYAGWGLTHDQQPPPSRRRDHRPSLERLAHAALIAYPRYLDPHHPAPCPPETLIRRVGLQRRRQREMPARIEAFGFKPWKRPILRRFLRGSTLRFRGREARPGPEAEGLVIWGRDPGRGVERRGRQTPAVSLLRVEDGFLRSVGLGANLIAPISWVVDRRGLYYDASASSDLEFLLAHHPFSAAELRRGAALRSQLLAAAITKYNLPALPWHRPEHARRVVLVPGQVETDASIVHGAPALRTNLELLRAVRRAEPEAWLVYKPHPDVVAGLRQGGGAEAELRLWCDEIVRAGAIEPIYQQVDAVHVLTSLAGFEALLRGVEVHTWGLPFYAGWGLTRDQLVCPRRGRRLSLDALVFAALVAYPRYVSRHSGYFIEPEEAIAELADWRREAPQPLTWWRWLFRHWGKWRERILPHRSRETGR
ncbi:MAG: capsular polysaccharide biosynthesis protein [Cyanobacteriota bacterium]|nr:capsular polysaccharide biosynthesis protein [Cyanobacteriota bacterium]